MKLALATLLLIFAKEGLAKLLLVAGGYQEGVSRLADVELIQLDSNLGPLQCPDHPASLPHATYQGVSSSWLGRPFICGGEQDNSLSYTRECYAYNKDIGDWVLSTVQLPRPMAFGAAVNLNSSNWLVTGGLSPNGDYLKATELYSSFSGEFEIFEDLPLPLYDHCMARINEREIFLAGGMSPIFSPTDRAWIFNLDARIWFELPSLETPRLSHSCSVSTDSNGNQKVVVAGGYNQEGQPIRTEVLDLKTLTWSHGPLPPVEIQSAASATFDHEFYLVGGKYVQDPITPYYGILKYDFLANDWTLMEETLDIPRYGHMVMFVPEADFQC